MEIIVTSDSTALMAIRIDTRIGRLTRRKLPPASELSPGRWLDIPLDIRPDTRPTPRKIRTGTTIVPNAPRGSRMKTLISIQVSFQSPRSIIVVYPSFLLANRVTGQFQKHVFKVGENGAKIRHADPILRQAVNHFGHQVVTLAANGEL